VAPPRTGWVPLAAVPAPMLRTLAADGAARVAGGEPRSAVWSQPLPGAAGAAGGTTALAWAADVLGFLAGPAAASAAANGPWVRLSTGRGHVLSRRPLLG
jgi:hypothetical protein